MAPSLAHFDASGVHRVALRPLLERQGKGIGACSPRPCASFPAVCDHETRETDHGRGQRAGSGFKDRLARQSEDALGRLAQDLLENPIVTSTISRAFEARERAVQAQETAMSALNIPSAADIERLTRRLRSVSQRMEGIEEAVDRVDERLEAIGRAPATAIDERLGAIEAQLSRLGTESPT